MPTNQFLPVASSGGANVATQAAYAANSGILNNGFQSGVVDSPTWNKTLRQTSLIAAMIGQIINDQAGVDANDTDSVATIEANFLRALRRFNTAGAYGVDSGSAANIYQFAYTPSVSAVQDGDAFRFRALHSATGASTFTPNPGTITAAPIVNADGNPLIENDILATISYTVVYSSLLTSWILIRAIQQVETKTKLTSGSGTYTTPAGVRQLKIRMVGGGGGGSGGGTSGGAGGIGGTTTFNSVNANGGNGASGSNGATGGGSGTGTANLRAAGNGGSSGIPSTTGTTGGGVGGGSFFGGSGAPGSAGATNTGGGGGGGAGTSTSVPTGAGGGGAEYVEITITGPSATYSYVVGAAGTAGTAGTGGTAGQAGGSGVIEVTEIY